MFNHGQDVFQGDIRLDIVDRPEDVAAAFPSGADAVLAASVFHDGDLTVASIKDFLNTEGVAVRT